MLIILLVPLLSYVEAGGLRVPKYIHSSQMMTWSNARYFCRTHHTDLVTIRDEQDYKHFLNTQGWIGLYRDGPSSQWKWSLRNEPATFTTFEVTRLDGDCVVKYPNNPRWKNEPCHTSHSFVCFDETLVLVKEEKTWEEALAHCRSIEVIDPTVNNNHTFDLATLLTQDDYNFAQEVIQDATTDQVWTGLRFLGDKWAWAGGEEMQYSNIKNCPIIMRCGKLMKNSSIPYNRDYCHLKMNFLCYRRA